MRIISVIYLPILLLVSCNSTRKVQEGLPSEQSDKYNFQFLNRYVIEHIIYSPTGLDFYPLLFEKGSPTRIGFLENFNIKSRDSLYMEKAILKGRKAIDIIPYEYGEKDNYIFERIPLVKYSNIEFFLKQAEDREMLFDIGDLYQVEKNLYYLPVTYYQKNEALSTLFSVERIYEFEQCKSGIFHPIKYYVFSGGRVLGYGEHIFSEYSINEPLCD